MTTTIEPKSITELRALCGLRHSMRTLTVILSWQMARDILATMNSERQRRVRKSHVATLERAMRNGTFIHNGSDCIVLDWNCHLMNGQHRMTAQANTKTKQKYQLTINEDPANFGKYDQQSKRTSADGCKVHGFKDPNKAAAVGRVMLAMNGTPVHELSVPDVTEFTVAHVDEAVLHNVYNRCRRSGMASAGCTVLAAACCFAKMRGVTPPLTFLSRVADGAELRRTSNEYKIRKDLLRSTNDISYKSGVAKKCFAMMGGK